MTHRILLADDSVTIRKVVELTFSDEDFTIDSVGDGAQAFEHAGSQRPDIIISDVVMPGMNGYDLCQRVKADPNLRSVPFLFLKGTFESFDEERARSCGADGFIVKPFESQEMIAKVKSLIEKSTAPIPVAIPTAVPLPSVAAEFPSGAVRGIPAAPAPLAAAPPASPARPVAQETPPVAAPRPAAPPPRPPTAPPPIPTMPPRIPPPAPPAPPRPIRPVTIPPAAMTPQPPAPAFVPPPPPPPPTPAYVPPPPAPPSKPAPADDFGFDFGESEGDHFGVSAAESAVHQAAGPATEPSGESDEDLWSEVSLRGGTSDLLEARAPEGAAGATAADIVELTEETAITAPDDLFEDESVFEEVSTARMTAPEPPAPQPATPPTSFAAPAPAQEEAAVAAAPPPAPAPVSGAAIAIDRGEIERIVAATVEAAVRKILEPIVSDQARAMIESVAWEVIPDLAEAMIRSEIERVRQSTRTD